MIFVGVFRRCYRCCDLRQMSMHDDVVEMRADFPISPQATWWKALVSMLKMQCRLRLFAVVADKRTAM